MRLIAAEDALLERIVRSEGEGADDTYVSVYLDLDPAEFATPRARRLEVESLADTARQEYTDFDVHRGLEHEDALARDIERVRQYLEAFRPEGARAVAVFCSSEAGMFETARLSRPTGPAMRIGSRAWLKPLVAVGTESLDCAVLAVDREDSRLLVADDGGLREVRGFGDRPREVGRRHADLPHQRRIEEHVKWHVEAVCQELATHLDQRPAGRLVLVTASELESMVRDSLRASERDRLIGTIRVADVAGLTPAGLLPEVRGFVDQERARARTAAREAVRESVGRGEGGAGLGPVLDIVNGRRVETLVMAAALEARGRRCPSCGWLAESGDRCPVDNTELRPLDDLAEAVIDASILQSAVVQVWDDDGLEEFGGVGARPRYAPA